MVLYVCGFIGIIVPLVYLAPHADASFVFTTFVNDGGWSTQGVSFFVGISGMAFGFLGEWRCNLRASTDSVAREIWRKTHMERKRLT